MKTRIVGVTLLLLLSGIGSFAQSYYGGLRGIVSDPTGQAIEDATVKLKNEATNVERSVNTNSAGEYVFSSVDPGSYGITVSASGFKAMSRSAVTISTQQLLTLDFGVQMGSTSEVVQVVGEVPILESSNASNGQVIDSQKLSDLPILGRNPFLFSRLNNNVAAVGDPRFNRFQDQSGSSAISIAGGPVRGNNYLIDGIPITDSTNRAVIIPSIEATNEVKLQANTYDAQMGRTGGGVFNTTLKSGSNGLHGSLVGYTRQTDWLANSFFINPKPRPETPFYNYGGSLGGPVVVPKIYDGRNKTFFWITEEGYRQQSPLAINYAVPTALERKGDFSKSGITIKDPVTGQAFEGNVIPQARLNPVGVAIAAAYPLPTIANVPYSKVNYSGSDVLKDRADEFIGKLDHQFFSWWQTNASYLHYGSTEPGGNPLQNVAGTNGVSFLLFRKVDAFNWNNTLLPSSTMVVNVGFGFNRFPNRSLDISQGFDQTTLGFPSSYVSKLQKKSFPVVNMANFASLATANSGNSVFYSRNAVVNVSKYLGKHNLKTGFNFRSMSVDFTDVSGGNGSFTFSDTDFQSKNDLVNLLTGYPSAGQVSTSTFLATNAPYYAVYFQDDYRITDKLTLNLGLRYEWEAGVSERSNKYAVGFDMNVTNPLQASSGYPTKGGIEFAGLNGYPSTCCNYSNKKFGPRVGAAYALTPKTSIRLGYGIFYAPVSFTGSSAYAPGYSQTTTYVASNDGMKTPAGSLSNPYPGGVLQPSGNANGYLTGVGSSVTSWYQGAQSPIVHQYSLDIQRELPGQIALQVGYVGSLSRHLLPGNTMNFNQLPSQYLSLGAQLLNTVDNPYYLKGGTGVIGGPKVAYNQLLRPFPEFASVNLYNYTAEAKYDALIIKAQKRYRQGLTFLSTYTWSKNQDSTWAASNFLNSSPSAPQDIYNLGAEWSRSVVDLPQRFTIAATYQLPIGENKWMSVHNSVLNFFLANWSVNVVSILQTGFPLAITQNANNNSKIGTAVQRPNIVAGVNPCVSGSPEDHTAPGNPYLNPAAFQAAPAYTFGNAPRTIGCLSPGYENWDISVFKSFPIRERITLQFRAEALNAFNTPQFRAPNTAVGNANFGRITQQANFPRYLQLGGRISF
ncbi:MAG TPA: TonB-dependent receptor [Candidatus Dormibacteraeota bacterium]|nr:TonB-dependent receptor [Candidatus Dormibacteraeota bacterium]